MITKPAEANVEGQSKYEVQGLMKIVSMSGNQLRAGVEYHLKLGRWKGSPE